MSVGFVKDPNALWGFQDVLTACKLYERESKEAQSNKNSDASLYTGMFQRYPTCDKNCRFVSCKVIFICVVHGNVHICTRDTCECIIDKVDEHQQVCYLTGTEYIREFENVFGYDEADEDAIDPDSYMSFSYNSFEDKDSDAVSLFKEKLNNRRNKRQRVVDKFQLSSDDTQSNTVAPGEEHIKEDNTNQCIVQQRKPRRHKKNRKTKPISDMSDLEKKGELFNDFHLIGDALKRFNINKMREDVIHKCIYDTWVTANKKEYATHKNKSTFYTLYMHVSVVFRYFQDGMQNIIPRIPDIFTNVQTNPLTATDICSSLNINSKHYTACCTIFRNIMKEACTVSTSSTQDSSHSF